MTIATMARNHGRGVQHLISRIDPDLTECGRDTRLMAKYSPSDLPSGERTAAPTCRTCRKERAK